MRGNVHPYVLWPAILAMTGASHAQDRFRQVAEFYKGCPLQDVDKVLPHDMKKRTGLNQYWIIQVERTGTGDSGERRTDTYHILFGPDPTKADTSGQMIITDNAADESNFELAVIEGVACYIGASPYGGTRGGSGIAGPGAVFMTYGRDDRMAGQGRDDFFIYLHEGTGQRLRVWQAGDADRTKSRPIEDAGSFLQVPDRATDLSRRPVHRVSDDASIEAVVAATLELVEWSGLTERGGSKRAQPSWDP